MKNKRIVTIMLVSMFALSCIVIQDTKMEACTRACSLKGGTNEQVHDCIDKCTDGK